VTSIEDRVLESFYMRLAEPDGLPVKMTERLKGMLAADKLPKPEQVVTTLSAADGVLG
jgi:hypothetical protein